MANNWPGQGHDPYLIKISPLLLDSKIMKMRWKVSERVDREPEIYLLTGDG
jgi:hypothetical protein